MNSQSAGTMLAAMSRLLAIAALCVVVPLAACGGGDDEMSADTGQTTTAAEQAGGGAERKPQDSTAAGGSGVTVSTHDSDYGTIVTDGKGRALYLFDKETSDRSQCYGACAEAWPPLLTKGEPQAAGGAQASKLGTTKRSDGTTQVTYNGQPVYYYVDDTAPGEVGCQNVSEFGGLWLVVDPSGSAIQ
jgi:predicted lipoprotein with Yx(FWY)xxD motif